MYTQFQRRTCRACMAFVVFIVTANGGALPAGEYTETISADRLLAFGYIDGEVPNRALGENQMRLEAIKKADAVNWGYIKFDLRGLEKITAIKLAELHLYCSLNSATGARIEIFVPDSDVASFSPKNWQTMKGIKPAQKNWETYVIPPVQSGDGLAFDVTSAIQYILEKKNPNTGLIIRFNNETQIGHKKLEFYSKTHGDRTAPKLVINYVAPYSLSALRSKKGEPPPGDPEPDVVLRHTFNGNREDILDWSHHGAIGEFFIGDRIPTAHGKGIMLYGEYGKNQAAGYRIMPCDALKLDKGAVSFWLAVDPLWHPKKQGVVLAAAKNGKKKNIAVVKVKNGTYELKVTLGAKPLETKRLKLKVNTWHHVTWTFTKTAQVLYVDGRQVATSHSGARLDGENSLYVGHAYDEKKGKRLDGLGAVLDDLVIYSNPKVAVAHPVDSPAVPDMPPTGLIVDLEFDDAAKTEGGYAVAPDDSGFGLTHQITELGADNGPPSPLLHGDKGSYYFKYKMNETRDVRLRTLLRFMPDERLKGLKTGTVEIVFQVNEPDKAVTWIRKWVLLSSHPNANPADNPNSQIFIKLWNPDKDRAAYEKFGYKKIPFCEIGFRCAGAEGRTKYMFKTGDWIKFVFAWDTNTSRTWINNVRVFPVNTTGFIVYPSCVLCLGSSQSGQGVDGNISRFRLWNYKRAFQPGALPMAGNMPNFHMDK